MRGKTNADRSPTLSRRGFLLQSAAAAVAGSAWLNASAGSGIPDKPNIVLIMTDQQTASAISCAGNAWLSTPAMDMLARQGIRFDQACVTQPLCMPSRSSL